jgi:hypothetical protein
MAKAKFDEITRSFLKNAYVDAVEEHGGPSQVTAEFNRLFFAKMRGTEVLADFSDAQMRGSLLVADVYVAVSPRQEPKKGGVKKAQLAEELNRLVSLHAGQELVSINKLNMGDMETLIELIVRLE